MAFTGTSVGPRLRSLTLALVALLAVPALTTSVSAAEVEVGIHEEGVKVTAGEVDIGITDEGIKVTAADVDIGISDEGVRASVPNFRAVSVAQGL